MAHEIMQNDNMFAVGRAPWHGLGVVLDSPPTIMEGLAKANLNWGVKLLPLFCQLPQINQGRRTAGLFHQVSDRAVLRTDTNEILGSVGANYAPLQNADAFNVFAPLVESKELLLETAGSLKNGRRVWILGRINIDGADVMKNDEVRPYVLLSNSHDGTMAARFGFTPIRVVCNNTLSFAEKGESSKLIRLIHTPSIHGNLDMLRNVLDLSKVAFVATVKQYRWLANRNINSSDLEKYVKIVLNPDFEKLLTEAQAKDEAVEMIVSPTQEKVIRLFERDAGLTKSSWWGAYNAVNEWLMYERGRSVDNRLNSVWFADGYNLNRRALDTALKMAA